MGTLDRELDAGREEVELYFSFLSNLLSSVGFNSNIELNLGATGMNCSIEQQCILKASFFVVLYNLMEKIHREGVDALNKKLEGVLYSDLIENIRRELHSAIVDALMKKEDKAGKNLSRYIADCVKGVYRIPAKTSIFQVSGNVNKDHFVRVLSLIGSGQKLSVDQGELIAECCRLRNDLAHGNRRFVEIGRSKALCDLEKFKEGVMEVLEMYVLEVSSFLSEKRYLS